MRRLLFIGLMAFSAAALAGTNIIILNNGYGGYPSYWPERVEVFDDSVFNLKPEPQAETSRGGRPYDADLEETPAQRKAWIRKCAPMKDRGHRAFQDCYESLKTSALSRGK